MGPGWAIVCHLYRCPLETGNTWSAGWVSLDESTSHSTSTLEGLCWASTAGGERHVCIATLKHLVPPTHNKQNGRAIRHHLMHLAPASPLSKEVFGASKCIWAFMRNCSADIYCGWNNCMRLCTIKRVALPFLLSCIWAAIAVHCTCKHCFTFRSIWGANLCY